VIQLRLAGIRVFPDMEAIVRFISCAVFEFICIIRIN